MNTLEAIAARRSIRKFKDAPMPDEALRVILTAAIQAPSPKNSQSWRFVVVSGDKRAEMVRLMRQGIAAMRARGQNIGSAEHSARIMAAAPVTLFVFYPEGMAPWLARSIHQRYMDLVNIQTLGAAIQNMLLAARHLGIGSLWIGDILFAYQELCSWLGESGELVAAVSFGYPDESPPARPRKPVAEVTRWV